LLDHKAQQAQWALQVLRAQTAHRVQLVQLERPEQQVRRD
jgi:hypothetical protein